ncbi:hypothetical protein OUZ56_008231 [Daphnia magna]|uniref:Uncharacterized protein n=1 Tax=Daphnia magna TaxID=35525 RepID=A0ABR0ACP5_9CRUS|nr:hypothetical protein OUZ56_008231 [Daphnia magna]
MSRANESCSTIRCTSYDLFYNICRISVARYMLQQPKQSWVVDDNVLSPNVISCCPIDGFCPDNKKIFTISFLLS